MQAEVTDAPSVTNFTGPAATQTASSAVMNDLRINFMMGGKVDR